MGIYWVFSVLLIVGLDYYAVKKLGSKRALAYKLLRIPKLFSLMAVSGYTLVFFILTRKEILIENNLFTFLGLPYFVVWIFFLVNVVRRLKAEKKGKNWR